MDRAATQESATSPTWCERRLGGASERGYLGASERRLRGASERRLGGASERRLGGASESAYPDVPGDDDAG